MKKLYKGEEIHTDYIKYEPLSVPLIESDKIHLDKVPMIKKLIDALPRTFSTEYSPQRLKKLRQYLIDDNFIFDEITENQFVYLFTDRVITDKMKPIRWKIRWGAKESLRYFLEYLIIKVHKKQVAECFVDIDNEPMAISKPNRNKPVTRNERHIQIRIEKIIHSI